VWTSRSIHSIKMAVFETAQQAALVSGIIDAVCAAFLLSIGIFVLCTMLELGCFEIQANQAVPRSERACCKTIPSTVLYSIVCIAFSFACAFLRSLRKLLFFSSSFHDDFALCDFLSRYDSLFYCIAKCLFLMFLGARATRPLKHFKSKYVSRGFVISLTFVFCLMFVVFGALGTSSRYITSDLITQPGVCRSHTDPTLNSVMDGTDAVSSVILFILFLTTLQEMSNQEPSRGGHWNHIQLHSFINENLFIGGSMTIIACICLLFTTLSNYYFSDADNLFLACLLIVELTANSFMQFVGIRKFWRLKPEWDRTFGVHRRIVNTDILPEREDSFAATTASAGETSLLLNRSTMGGQVNDSIARNTLNGNESFVRSRRRSGSI
jgi:hypothetical protein